MTKPIAADAAKTKRATEAMFKMRKLDIAALEAVATD